MDERDLCQPRGDEPLADRIGLIEAVLDDERAARLEVLARRGADPVVERQAVGAAVEREQRLARTSAESVGITAVAMYGGFEQIRSKRSPPTGAHRSPSADLDAIGEAVALGIALGDRDRRLGELGRDDASPPAAPSRG